MVGVKGEATSGYNREGESTDAQRRDGAGRSSDEGSVMELERRGCVVQPRLQANCHSGGVLSARQEEPASAAKPFLIPKREIWEAFILGACPSNSQIALVRKARVGFCLGDEQNIPRLED